VQRLLQELKLHTGLTAVGASETDIRTGYIPVFKQTLMKMFKEDKVDEVLEFMDTYGLSRDDVMETFDDFILDKQSKLVFGSLSAMEKRSFTTKYNSGTHMSQALVKEQGFVKKKKTAKKDDEEGEGGNSSESEADDEADAAAAAKLFAAKKKKGGKKKPAAKKAPAKKKK